MNWPDLQLEHLAFALIASWLALGCFAWQWGHEHAAQGRRSEPAWNWLGAASLLGAFQPLAWLVLMMMRFEAWPDWARLLLNEVSAARGLAACLAALAWFNRPTRGLIGWIAIVAGATVLSRAHLSAAHFVGGLGWFGATAAFVWKPATGLKRSSQFVFGAALLSVGVTEIVMPDLTQLLLRLPAEQPPQWGSPELLILAAQTFATTAAALTLWVGGKSGQRRWIAAAFGAATIIFGLSYRETIRHAAARARMWTQLEATARELAPAAATLRAEPADLQRPEMMTIVTHLRSAEATAAQPIHFWLWRVEDGLVTNLADAATLGELSSNLQIPPGYRYSQLANFVLRAKRNERFESGPFFTTGEKRAGMHVPLLNGDGRAVAWIQAAMPLPDWQRRLSDARAPTVIGLLALGALGSLALAGRSWFESSRRLREQALEATTNARAKNEMAGLVSHELRTPLQVVLGHLELLSSSSLPAEAQRSLQIIDDQCRQLLGLVNDTLDLCALEAQALSPRPERFAPAELTASVIGELRALALQRGLTLDLQLDPELPALVDADARRLRQILTNLLANAVKYTPTGLVWLRVWAELGLNGRLVFSVSDTGPGLPTEVLKRLGEPFHPGSNGQGTGLGLALVHRLCRHLGGEFTAENAATGGCLLTVRVPAPHAAPDAAPFAPVNRSSVGPGTLAGTRILLAEDNTLVRELLATQLRQLGAEVEAVADGAAALSACRSWSPDALVVDLAMPGIDGRTVVRALRQSLANESIPKAIVGLSAQTLTEAEARAAGFDHFFVKPVGIAQLAAVIAPQLRAMNLAELPAARLRSLFAREAPTQLSALKTAVAQGAHDEVACLCHYLQSSAYALSDDGLRAACANLYQWAKSPDGPIHVDDAVRSVEVNLLRILR